MLSTKPYKGSRDFFPEEMRRREWMFSLMQKTVESFGFEKIDAPVIEPLDIYLAKTSEEIVNQQIYSFEDRGGRKVAIRPEMTPTVSRMAAARLRETPKPIRWFSIPNLWRYEKMGKGRLREHWQLNADIFGAPDEAAADLEIIQLATSLLRAYGADSSMFRVALNNRHILNSVFNDLLKIPAEKNAPVARVLDKKAKVSEDAFNTMLVEEGISSEQKEILIDYLENGTSFLEQHTGLKGVSELLQLIKSLDHLGLTDYVEYDPAVVRGFDYYTGMIFEIYDRHPENRRSLFGGGRYDNLIGNFSKESANAVGFGMGDVTLADFLETHKLMRQRERSVQIYVTIFNTEEDRLRSFKLSAFLRENGFSVEQSLGPAKLGKQFQEAEKKNIPYVIIQGKDEADAGEVQLKSLESGDQVSVKESELVEFLQNKLNR